MRSVDNRSPSTNSNQDKILSLTQTKSRRDGNIFPFDFDDYYSNPLELTNHSLNKIKSRNNSKSKKEWSKEQTYEYSTRDYFIVPSVSKGDNTMT